jgi:beta-carotene/zeaxanthin 4-ketolase
MQLPIRFTGLVIAIFIISLWCISLYFLLSSPISSTPIFVFLFVLLQTHLFTGVFITAHDSIHGTVHSSGKVNRFVGRLCCVLFAFNDYAKLTENHHLHHKYPATDQDPDFYEGHFFKWYYSFLKRYITWRQIIFMALAYNILKLFFNELNVILFWILPSLLSTLQLFYFGTYLPHKGEHHAENKHNSRSFYKNHFVAFITCYFFGYHYQHHSAPHYPWWKLYEIR